MARIKMTFHKCVVVCARLAIITGLLLFWQFSSDSLLDEMLWSRPTMILEKTVLWLRDGTIWSNSLSTFVTVAAGLAIGIVVGVAAGLLVGSRENLSGIRSVIDGLFALPKITLVPLFILWFGIGAVQHVIFTAVVVFFFFYYAMNNGLRGMPESYRNSLTLLGASSFQRFYILILPASVGWMASALKLALPYAFVAAISTEVIASTSGLGNLVKNSASIFDSAGMFSALIVLLAISLMSSFLASKLASKIQWNLN